MIDTYLRSPYQRLLVDPIANRLVANPNAVTLIGALLGVAVLPLLATHHSVLALLSLLLSGYCDTLDGTLARKLAKTSPKGAVFDICSDRLVETAVIIGLALVNPEQRAMVCLFMVASVLLCITSFLVVGIFSTNDSQKSFHYSPGIMERTEAFLFFCAMIALPTLFIPLAITFSVLVTLTAVVRLVQFYSMFE